MQIEVESIPEEIKAFVREDVIQARHESGDRAKRVWLRPSQSVEVRFTPTSFNWLNATRVYEHRWGGLSVPCTERTAPEMLAPEDRHKKCQLCPLIPEVHMTAQICVIVYRDDPIDTPTGVLEDDDGNVIEETVVRYGSVALLAVNTGLLDEIEKAIRAHPHLCDLHEGWDCTLMRTADWKWELTLQLQRSLLEQVEAEADREEGVELAPTQMTSLLAELEGSQPPFVEHQFVRQFTTEDLEGIQNNLGHEQDHFMLDALMDASPDAVFVADILGTKHPHSAGWQKTTLRDMQDRNHLRILRKSNIARLNGAPSHGECSFDIDTDDGVPAFLDVNPWARPAQFSHARRGGNVHFRLAGQYPMAVVPFFYADLNGNLTDRAFGEFRGAGKTTVAGWHPCGVPYVIERLGEIPTIHASDIKFPPGVKPRRKVEVVHSSIAPTRPRKSVGLNLNKLRFVREVRNGTQAQCPVCARHGTDTHGDNLMIWPNGKWSCIKKCSGGEIFRLAGACQLDNEE